MTGVNELTEDSRLSQEPVTDLAARLQTNTVCIDIIDLDKIGYYTMTDGVIKKGARKSIGV